jgi:hypothetical protein
MSYDIYLVHPDTLKAHHFDKKHQLTGGTYAVGGTTEAHLNITYNYASFFYKTIDADLGIRWLYDRVAKNTFETLTGAIMELGIERTDYWDKSPGNAGAALLDLLTLGIMYPEGIWHGD